MQRFMIRLPNINTYTFILKSFKHFFFSAFFLAEEIKRKIWQVLILKTNGRFDDQSLKKKRKLQDVLIVNWKFYKQNIHTYHL